jgi:glycosyltransferase involved in cell wall biosynthesis
MTLGGGRSLISIITPSYNQASFIEETLLSVARQDYPDIEHIVVDGGSTDGSVEIIQAHAQRSPERIRWVSEPDEGQADAINKGFRMATGRVVAWLNSDDAYLYRSTISEVADAFRRMPEADVIYGDAIRINESNCLLRVLCSPPFSYDWLLRGYRLTQPAIFFRRRVVEAEELDASITIVLDYEYMLRLARKYHIVHIPSLWAVDRNHRARKILARHDELVRQKWAIRRSFGQNSDAMYYLQRLLDMAVYGFPYRVRGLFALPALRKGSVEALAIPLHFESTLRTIWHQLFTTHRGDL